jgi:hypothetical protein
MKKILFISLIIIVLLISVFILPLYYPSGVLPVYFRLLLLFLILIESIKLFKVIFIDIKINKIISNAGIVLFSVFILFILLEAIFMFIPQSHSIDCTLASKLWYQKYWKPINSSGFRDNEPGGNKPSILFVGDSFTAGAGLKSVDDRFSNIVGKELNKNEIAINIGKLSLNSMDEYIVMKNYIYMTKIKPKTIVLQYCGNDILNVCMNKGLKFGGFNFFKNVDKVFIPVIEGSYLINYIFWSFPKQYINESLVILLNQAYKNDDMLAQHKDELMLFVDYARNNSIQLIVVVFPFLQDLKKSDSMYVTDMVNFFEVNGVPAINVSALVKDIPLSERVININDGHASKKVNRIVAQEILKKLNNPASSSGVSKGTCAPRGGELDPQLSRSASPRG